ncbi:MAG TPA: alkaline shock response membrane anchor protein AmaP [Kiritimatiellia bacterium]|nr:alkaline shock response membrane anchor protein AmaP [Kiritimatiellia bacterium]
MKILHYVIGAVLFIAILAISLFVLSTVFQGAEAWANLLEAGKAFHVPAAVAALTVALLVLLFVLTSFRLPEKSQYIAYDIEGSAVSISLRAVQDFLARLADEFAAVEELKPALKVSNTSVDVQLDVKIRAGAQIPELCRMLQERARATLREKVGLSDITEVRVRVQEIVGDSKVESAPERPETFTA